MDKESLNPFEIVEASHSRALGELSGGCPSERPRKSRANKAVAVTEHSLETSAAEKLQSTGIADYIAQRIADEMSASTGRMIVTV